MNWEKDFEDFMIAVHALPFSKRQRFFKYLQLMADGRLNDVHVAWPDVLLFLEAGDWARALKEVTQ